MFEGGSGGKLRFRNYLRQLRQPKAYFCFNLVLFLYLCLLFTFSTEVILKSVLKKHWGLPEYGRFLPAREAVRRAIFLFCSCFTHGNALRFLS